MPSLGNDLAQIRKERHLTIEDIYETTKIPTYIISSIEDDSIFKNPEINATYIRSYIRSYARVVGIDEKQILHALDKQEKDNYAGSLQKPLDKPDEKVAEYDDEEPQDSSERKDHTGDGHPPDETQKKGAKEESSLSPQPDKKAPDVNSVDWVAMGRKAQRPLERNSKMWVIFVFLILIIVVGLVYYFYYGENFSAAIDGSPETPESSVSTDSPPLNELNPGPAEQDTINASQRAASNVQSQALNALPDTLTMTVYAAYGKLEPARVYTDIINNTNPYWIEKGEALRFHFVNEFRIRGTISNIVLLLNGHIIKNIRDQFYDPDTRLIKINRSFFEDDPKWLQPAPDSLNIKAPAPSVIKNRPTFNDSM